MSAPLNKKERGVSLMEVSVSLVLLTLFLAGGLKLYIETMSRQLVSMRAQEARNLSLSVHAEELENLFVYDLGKRDLGTYEIEERTYHVTMNLAAVDGLKPKDARLAEYDVLYKVDNVEKRTSCSVLVSQRG